MNHRTTPAAHELLTQGQIAMSEIEATGIRVDKAHLESTIDKVIARIDELKAELKTGEVYREWKQAYGDKLNFGSDDQLADVLFVRMGMQAGGKTAGGRRHSTAKDVLELIDHPFVKKYLQIGPLENSLRTNLRGIQKEMVERDGMWFVHPNNNLNTVTTFRPSSDHPNWKNYPKRNPEIAALVRPCFIARPGNRFGEVDQAQIEVRVPACEKLTNDPELIRYINDPKSDMHKDQAAIVHLLKKTDVSKPIRQSIKTNFVFAGFYGSPYYNTAKKLWDDIDRFNLKTESGVPLKVHLKSKGIDRLGVCDMDADTVQGTFVHQVRLCERKLWDRFSVYKEWKNSQVERYHRDGGMTMITGFAINGPHARTEIPNYEIQGPAYHITLWSIIQLLKWFRKLKMRTLILEEIYDSVQFDIAPGEVDELLDLCERVMTKDVRKYWDWITVPLQVEASISPIDGSWYDCEDWFRKNGKWCPR